MPFDRNAYVSRCFHYQDADKRGVVINSPFREPIRYASNDIGRKRIPDFFDGYIIFIYIREQSFRYLFVRENRYSTHTGNSKKISPFGSRTDFIS